MLLLGIIKSSFRPEPQCRRALTVSTANCTAFGKSMNRGTKRVAGGRPIAAKGE